MARLLYFGRLADALGKAGEDISIDDANRTAGNLRRLHPSLDDPQVKLVVNKVLVRDDAPICDDDEIAFLPPVSGG